MFNLASVNRNGNDSDALALMYELHNKLLAPENIAHDYLPEEMVLDGKAPWMTTPSCFCPTPRTCLRKSLGVSWHGCRRVGR
ncbi:MAG: hypothetical protein Ct9H300mP1_16360 [Planctomycetaceae bacterium]|nr:MAG: hypothetical protein Ct9H300mP1_16360 [Planctomycetaceae bacterium]